MRWTRAAQLHQQQPAAVRCGCSGSKASGGRTRRRRRTTGRPCPPAASRPAAGRTHGAATKKHQPKPGPPHGAARPSTRPTISRTRRSVRAFAVRRADAADQRRHESSDHSGSRQEIVTGEDGLRASAQRGCFPCFRVKELHRRCRFWLWDGRREKGCVSPGIDH